MAAHGVSRSTQDVDFLVVDASVLEPARWQELRAEGVSVDLRRGDADDPLAGVVRIDSPGERPIDLIVGRFSWQRRALDRAQRLTHSERQIPVVTLADLILLKLYAGGVQDAWDIEQLLAAGDRKAIEGEVESQIADLPDDARALWNRIA